MVIERRKRKRKRKEKGTTQQPRVAKGHKLTFREA
jgi:hypothetical protein